MSLDTTAAAAGGGGGGAGGAGGGGGKGVSRRVLVGLASVLVSTQFAWSIQTAFATTLFKQLGARQRDLGYLRVPGPLTGLLVQPAAGSLSDELGYKRRPRLILSATVLCGIGFVLLPLGVHSKSIWLVFTGCCFFDVGFNAADALVRVLAADVTPKQQLPLANSIVSSALGCGQLLGFVASSIGSFHLDTVFGKKGGNTSLVFACSFGLVLLVLCDSFFVSACRKFPERSLDQQRSEDYSLIGEEDNLLSEPAKLQDASSSSSSSGSRPKKSTSAAKLVRHFATRFFLLPRWMYKLCLMNGLVWIGWFCFIFFAPDFIGIFINGGDPHAPKNSEQFKKYDLAQQQFSMSSAISSVLMIAMGPCIPFLVEKIGIHKLMAASAMALALVLFIASNVLGRGSAGACVFLFSLIGVPWAVTMSIPYTVVSILGQESERGFLMGVLNIFVVLPSFLVLLMVGVTNMRSNHIFDVGSAMAGMASFAWVFHRIHPNIESIG